jgi:hypothetical protein
MLIYQDKVQSQPCACTQDEHLHAPKFYVRRV